MSRDALVVGINTYQYLPSLKAPARDAEAIAQRLQMHGEFRVHRLPEVIQNSKPQIGQKTPVMLRELETALINLFKPKGRSIPQTAVFYFSGHGIQRDAGIQEGYLALSDSNPDQGFYGLSLFWLRRLLQESPVRQRIILLDCCHSGELLNFLEADPGAHPGTDRLFMAASRDYETAYESLNSEYSVFTEALLSGLDPYRLPAGIVTNHSLTDWVNHSLKGEIQQPLFESSGSEIILTRSSAGAVNGSSAAMPTAATEICPYPGLDCFDESQSDYFFGRQDLTAQLLQQVTQAKFVAVTGASGSGKSSLVRAGLIAQLRQGQQVPGSQHWKVKQITPTENPLKSLAAAFIDPDLSDLERAEQLRRAETFLQDGGTGLAQLVRASLPETGSTTGLIPELRPRFLLVIDQFEEVFTLSYGSQAERERQEFFDCLLGALDQLDCLNVVIGLRSDFLGKCALYEGLAQQIFQHQLTVGPMNYDQLKAAVLRPAQKVGLTCEPNLVYTMMMDVIGAPGELPLLQYTLLELWKDRRVGQEGSSRLTLDSYQALGGIRGTLQKRATDLFNGLNSEEQGIAKRIFLALTQLGEGTEDTRRRVPKSELVSPAFPALLVNQVLEKLVAAKLVVISQAGTHDRPNLELPLTPEQSPLEEPALGMTLLPITPEGADREGPRAARAIEHQEIVDVAHEALIRNWTLLRNWLEEQREMLRRQRRIEQSAQEWYEAGQPTTEDYLLHGLRLRDAEDFLKLNAQELSALAQQYISVSCLECRRIRRASRRLQWGIPSLLAASLTMVLTQYYGVLRTHTETDDQLQQSIARERAAIAQTVLQDTQSDPMTALLISRLAVQGQPVNYEAQASLRTALQNLRLQSELRGHHSAIQQIRFSPDRRYLATADAAGEIRLWTMNPQTIYNQGLQAAKMLSLAKTTSLGAAAPSAGSPIAGMAFSPDGQQLAAINQDSAAVQLWSVASGQPIHRLTGSTIVQHIEFSASGRWLVGRGADRSLMIWDASTGRLQAQLMPNPSLRQMVLSKVEDQVLTAAEDGTAQLWQIVSEADTVKLNLLRTFNHPEVVEQVAFSSQDRWIVTRDKAGMIRIWDRQTGQLRSEPTGVAQPATAHPLAAPTNTTALPPILRFELGSASSLALIDRDQQIWIWDIEAGRVLTQLHPTTDRLSESSAISPGDQGIPRGQHAQDAQSVRSGRLTDGHLADGHLALVQLDPNYRSVVTTADQPSPHTGLYSAELWDQSGALMGQLSGHRQPISAVQFSPDGTYVVTASQDGSVRLWSAAPGGELPAFQSDQTLPLTFLSRQSLPNSPIAPGSNSAAATDVSSAAMTAAIQANPGSNGSSPQSPAGLEPLPFWKRWQQSVVGQATGQIAGQVAGQVAGPSAPVASPNATSPNAAPPSADSIAPLSTYLIGSDPTGQLQRWQILTDPTGLPQVPQLGSPSGFSGSHRGAIQPIESTGSLLDKLINLTGLGASESGSWVKSGLNQVPQRLSPALEDDIGPVADRQEPRLAESDPSTPMAGLDANPTKAAISSKAVSADGRWLAAADVQGRVTVYRVQGDQTLQVAYQLQNWRSEVKVATAANQVNDNPNTGMPEPPVSQIVQPDQPVPTGEPIAIRQLVFSPDGEQLLGIADDLTLRTWTTTTGEMKQVFRGHGATVRQARFSADGQWIISAGWDRTARLWQSATGQLVKILPHADAVSSVDLSVDGQRVITADWNGTAQIWDLKTGKPLFSLTGHQDAILDVRFSPDNQRVVTASADGTARLWHAASGQEEAVLAPADLRGAAPSETVAAVDQAVFSPDGQYVATMMQTGQVNLWAATPEMLLKLAADRSVRQLTPEECQRYLRVPPDQCPQLSQD